MKRLKTADPAIVQYENGMFYFRRGPKEISLKTKDFKEAQKRKRVVESRGDAYLSVSLRIRFEDLKDDYLKSRDEDLAAGKIRISTLKETKDILDLHIMPYFGKKSVAKTDSLAWEAFRRTDLPGDLANIRKVFGHFIKWCAKNGYKRDIPILDINRVARRQRRILTPKEIQDIWDNAHGGLKLFVALALSMGLRRTEIMTLEWSRINFEKHALFLPKHITKTKRERWVPIALIAFNILVERMKDQGGSSRWVFPHATDSKKHAYISGLTTAWRTCLRKAFSVKKGQPMPNITWHDLRATCEYYAHKRTDLSATQLEKFFGSSVDVQRKIYVSMDADDLRGVEDSLSLPQLTPSMGKTRGEVK